MALIDTTRPKPYNTGPILRQEAIEKVDQAYPVIEVLKKSIKKFQNDHSYHDKCFTVLQIENTAKIIDGIDLLAKDNNIEPTIRIKNEKPPF